MASGVVVIITAWCIQMRGPLFASVFNPLMLVIVAVTASLMLDEKLYLGRYFPILNYLNSHNNNYICIPFLFHFGLS